jgi:hypothetical protein
VSSLWVDQTEARKVPEFADGFRAKNGLDIHADGPLEKRRLKRQWKRLEKQRKRRAAKQQNVTAPDRAES